MKMKIGGASLDEDRRRIEAVLEVVGEGRFLAVDANGRFDLDTAIAYAEALEPYGLFWYEEAGDPLDYALQAELARHYARPMATGREPLQPPGRAEPSAAWRDAPRPGLAPVRLRVVLWCRRVSANPFAASRVRLFEPQRHPPRRAPVCPLNIAAGLKLGGNESYPEVFAPFGGFADDIRVENGRVGLPQAPGIGFERKSALIDCMRTATET